MDGDFSMGGGGDIKSTCFLVGDGGLPAHQGHYAAYPCFSLQRLHRGGLRLISYHAKCVPTIRDGLQLTRFAKQGLHTSGGFVEFNKLVFPPTPLL